MVLIYHLFCWVYNPIGRFNIGFVGVDFFLFFSGFGLTFSLKNNSIKEFYKRRLRKIYPLYFIASIFVIILTTTQYTPIHKFIINPLLQLTTISYYIDVQNSIDWYLNSLFLFYLLFPIFYKLVLKYDIEFYFFLIFICVSFYIFGHFSLHWKYDCFFARIPIFCLGIVFATQKFSKEAIYKFSRWNLILAIPLYFYISEFLFFSFFVPYLILIFQKISVKIKSSKLEFLGKHSLEIYCANLIPWKVLPLIDSITTKVCIYFILQFVMSFFFIKINKQIQKKLTKTPIVTSNY
jgi:peptidoglycan/LPS O-acetylase OafA/YrhL